jgi:hypothetical protein
VLLLHGANGDAFFELTTQYRFKPAAAHLGSMLRIVGQCLFPDGSPGGGQSENCPTSVTANNNLVLEFAVQPDGGAW